MDKKTYGAQRLVDWVAQIKAGAATVRVHFTGGALTTLGITPAEYTTDNPFIQKVIEQSNYFKEGRITLLRTIKIPNTAPAGPKTPAKKQADIEQEVTTATGEDRHPAEVEDEAGGEETPDNLTTVEVSCLQDAQGYLQEKFNISSYKVRTYEAAQQAGAKHGVRFSGGKFGGAGGEETTVE